MARMVVVDVIGDGCNGLKKGNLCSAKNGGVKLGWCYREMYSCTLLHLIKSFDFT